MVFHGFKAPAWVEYDAASAFSATGYGTAQDLLTLGGQSILAPTISCVVTLSVITTPNINVYGVFTELVTGQPDAASLAAKSLFIGNLTEAQPTVALPVPVTSQFFAFLYEVVAGSATITSRVGFIFGETP